MLSGLNNLKTCDVFSDTLFCADYGLTESEMEELSQVFGFERREFKECCDGCNFSGEVVHNMYSVMCALAQGKTQSYWRRSPGAVEIASLANASRSALAQIERKDYAFGLDVDRLLKAGVACKGRKVKVLAVSGAQRAGS
jgi:hypothetical protein